MQRVYVLLWLFIIPAAAQAQDNALRSEAERSLKKAAEFFRTKVSVEGGYLWRYSEDLQRREGEGKATASQAWVQPPGTPSVGLALLGAYSATKDKYYLDAARETGLALVKGQLHSGGWDYRIEFDPKLRAQYGYRADGPAKSSKSMTTLDDNNTQQAVRFLMRLDQTLGFKDKSIHEATEYALACLLQAQYPNGAWPQRYADFPNPVKHPVKKAGYPESWSRTWPNLNYRGYYTLNDNTLADMIDVMLEAAEIYQQPKYRASALKGGDFIILAQMPDPQPGWAQQYDLDMHPAWARKFEPASITGGESQGAMLTLLRLYRDTGEKKYMEPIPRALNYYRKVQLSSGQMARFYELHTNKPLYFTKDYQLTYSDADMPTHYGFKTGNKLDQIAKQYEALVKSGPKPAARKKDTSVGEGNKALVKQIIADLDNQGRWVEAGKLKSFGSDDPTRRVITTQTFIRNVNALSAFLAAGQKAQAGRLVLVAGGGEETENVPATKAKLKSPFGVDFDKAGNMYIVELSGERVLKVDTKGILTILAGTGKKGNGGDGGQGRQAEFNGMHSLAIGRDGNLYLADTWNNRIRKLNPKTGIITAFAGTGKKGSKGDGGPALQAEFGGIYCVAVSPFDGRLFLADLDNRKIRVVSITKDGSGVVSGHTGTGAKNVPADGADAWAAPLVDPRAVAADSKGNVYILERGGHALRVVDTQGKLRTVVGTGKKGYSGDGGDARLATMNGPKHLCIDKDDNVIIADTANHVIRKYLPRENKIVLIAGTGKKGFSGNGGDPLATSFNEPHGVWVHNDVLYIVDSNNNRVFRLEH